MFRQFVGHGAGHVILDAAYDSKENCEAISKKGRMPIIYPKKNHVVKGFDARAKMLRRYHNDPDEYMSIYHQRSAVESVFSSIKERFSGIVRAKNFVNQKLELALRCICYNVTK